MFVFGTTVSEHLAAVPPPQEREEDIGVRRSVDDRKNELGHGRTRLQLPKVRPQGTLRTPPPRTRLRERQQRGRPRKGKSKKEAARTTGSTRLGIASTRQMGRKHRRSSEHDRIEDLVAEERAVLEQLEATRARLREKLADSPDYQILRAITDASASSTSDNQLQEPAANVRLENVFPALTNEGERPLEVGLQRGNHMLPIFQLPRVAKDAPLANPLPKEPTEEEKERLQAELDARAQARSHLGLSEDEVKYFDAVLKNGPSAPLPLPLPQASSTSDVDARKAARKGAKRNKRSISTKALTNPRVPQTSTVSSAVALRKELSTSIKSVQSLTNLVQDGVAALQREYPGAARTAKSKALVQRWGIAKLDQVFRKRDRARTRESLAQWQRFTQWAQLAEKQMVYQMMQGAGKLAHVLFRLQRARLASRMKRWIAIFDFERNNEEYVAMSRASVVIQRCWRGYRGRLWYAACKLQKELHEQHMAAAKLQSIFRGRHAKKKVSTLREKQILHRAARRMQTAFRARLARKRVIERRARLEAENLAALKMQAAWRRKRGQMAYHILRRARRDQAASRMQAIQRKRLAKRKVEAMRVHQRRERACLMVQRAYRSRLARKRMAERRVEYAKELEVKERCALRLQAVYRGHRGRLVYQLKSHARRAAQEHDAQQVSKIQSLFRGKKGRRKAAERRKEYLEEMCAWARAWVEEFDETTNDYVFRNLHTQEVYAEPPPDGYTKRDGMLALLDGRVLEDPIIVARREREKNLLQCIECDETAATRKCVECDDIYCDDCFDAIHLKGALASHAFEWFQDGGPQEAEPADLAAAGSTSADGGLVGAGAAPDWIELFDEESGYPYWYDQTTGVTTWEMPPELAQQQDVGPYDAAAGAEGMEGGSEWATYFDEASGQNYMYNATTGECIWEHEQQEQPYQDEGNVVYDENTGYPQEQDDGYGYY